MAATAAAKSNAAQSHDIHIVRTYDAPVQAVWDAWTDPKQVAQWWGPRGFTITTHSKDLRAGGHWNYTMHGPDGTDWPNTTRYFEVEPLKKLVYDHGGSEDRPPMFRVTVLFSEANGTTTMDMRMSHDTADALQRSREVIKKASGNSTWDRLAEYLEKEETGKEAFVIARTFEAPIDLMYDLWTKPEHFSQWLPPTGATMEFIRADIRPGGEGFFCMTMGEAKMYGSVQYKEMVKPNRIVYTQQFNDAQGNVSRHPLAPTWPETMLTTVTLTPEGPNSTRVLVHWEPTGDTTQEEIDTFVQGRAGMTQGWTGSFDKLDALLLTR